MELDLSQVLDRQKRWYLLQRSRRGRAMGWRGRAMGWRGKGKGAHQVCMVVWYFHLVFTSVSSYVPVLYQPALEIL